ncbi:hypothetical protein MATL_G00193830 [Megalops atlanticus]|uniref:Fibrinogen C-terminal domain-containing protein n=1 Tax=Megalops atlanticus TaxID=7932 RepID=A0A9D3PLP4_MEGAT|nr:hypothetical protein MATL_G00193830 [Megalops atlanticus]
MRLVHLFCCFAVLLSSASCHVPRGIVDPRGNRPVEQGYKSEKCATEKAWPVCTDEEWGPKCPSGCRIAGLLDEADKELAAKIDKIRKLLDESRRHYRSTDQATKQAYDFLREKLVTDAGNDNKYVTLAEQLRQRIVSIKIKIDAQLRLLKAMKERVRLQVREMQRLETDIDIKLRSCKGSCASYAEYMIDRDSYETLEKQFTQLDSMGVQSVETVSSLRTMKSRRIKDEDVPSIYKSGLEGVREEQKQDYFADVGQLQLTLEAEGGPLDKATGTMHHVTSPAGASTGTHTTVHTVKCTKTIRKSITYTKDGPVEKTEIVGEGPGCEGMGELGLSDRALLTAAKEGKDAGGDGYTVKLSGGGSGSGSGGGGGGGGGGMTSLFPEMSSFFDSRVETGFGSRGDGALGHTETKTFRQTSRQTSHSSSSITDGSLKGFSPSFMGEDMGEFMRGEVEEDLPDIHARSLKGPSGAPQRDYAGKDCVDIIQKHASGGKSGLFKIKPGGSEEVVEVYCDQDTMLGGWVLVQQRMDGSVNFNRTWKDYRNGFGSVDQQGRDELWLGNKYLHLLTQTESILRIELVDWEGKESYAEYSIRVGPEAEGYPLGVSEYLGDAGDALVRGQTGLGAFLSHANMKFSTYDRDNDKWEENCAEMYGGGWWYNNCQSANLNGIYYKGGQYDPGSNVPYEIENGVVWLPLKPADYSLKTVRMKVRPIETITYTSRVSPLRERREIPRPGDSERRTCKAWTRQTELQSPPSHRYSRRDSGRCSAQPQHPLCTDDDWDATCPSGCRLQGLIGAAEGELLDRFGRICDRTREWRNELKSTVLMTAQIYKANRKTIVRNYVDETRYLELMEELQKKLTSLNTRTVALSEKLKSQHSKIKQQMADIYKTEVDIEIKIRSCQGSCKKAVAYWSDRESYESLEKELDFLTDSCCLKEL